MSVVRILSIVAFVVVFENVLALSEEQTKAIKLKFYESGAECIDEHPLVAEELIVFKDKKLPENENTGCFLSCVFKKVGIFDDKGKLSLDDVLEHAEKIFDNEEEQKNIEGWINSCITVNDEEVSDDEKGCDRAKLAFSCLIENTEKFGFDIL